MKSWQNDTTSWREAGSQAARDFYPTDGSGTVELYVLRNYTQELYSGTVLQAEYLLGDIR